MRILVGCEFSGTVRRAFRRRGHDAVSCDILPTEDNGPHLQMDIFKAILYEGPWDMILLFPECRYMALCGNASWAGTPERTEALRWTECLWKTSIREAGSVALENPASVLWGRIGKPQYVHPWQFGHRQMKKTGLLLHNLPGLVSTKMVGPPPPLRERDRPKWEKLHYMGPSETRSLDRSRFFPGIAKAMAQQWG